MRSKGKQYIDWFNNDSWNGGDGAHVLTFARTSPAEYLDGTFDLNWDSDYTPVCEELFILASEVLGEQ